MPPLPFLPHSMTPEGFLSLPVIHWLLLVVMRREGPCGRRNARWSIFNIVVFYKGSKREIRTFWYDGLYRPSSTTLTTHDTLITVPSLMSSNTPTARPSPSLAVTAVAPCWLSLYTPLRWRPPTLRFLLILVNTFFLCSSIFSFDNVY